MNVVSSSGEPELLAVLQSISYDKRYENERSELTYSDQYFIKNNEKIRYKSM